MELQERLRELLDEQQPHLSAYAWPSEMSRWSELVFCLLHRLRPNDAELTRQAVQVLLAAGLLEIRTLAKLSSQGTTAFAYILASHGWSEAEGLKVIAILQEMARVIEQRFQGKLQRGVRRFAKEMHRELADTLGVPGLDRSDLDQTLAHWLQNAFSLPLSLENEAVRRFCEAYEVTPSELEDAADELDLNLALLDDLLEAYVASLPPPENLRPAPAGGRE